MFFRVLGWALLAYAVIAGILEFVFVYDHTPARLLALFTRHARAVRRRRAADAGVLGGPLAAARRPARGGPPRNGVRQGTRPGPTQGPASHAPRTRSTRPTRAVAASRPEEPPVTTPAVIPPPPRPLRPVDESSGQFATRSGRSDGPPSTGGPTLHIVAGSTRWPTPTACTRAAGTSSSTGWASSARAPPGCSGASPTASRSTVTASTSTSPRRPGPSASATRWARTPRSAGPWPA